MPRKVYDPTFPFVTLGEPAPPLSDIRELYPDAFVSDIARRYRIDAPEHKKALWDFLGFNSTFYLLNQERQGQRSRLAAVRREIADLAALLEGARRRFAELSPESQRLFWHADAIVHAQATHPDATKTEFGQTINRVATGPDSWIIQWLDRDSLTEALSVLAAYANHALGHLPPSKKGRDRTSEALRMWMVNAESFWTRDLGRPFTFDWQKGKPVSAAARFCCDLLPRLDPQIQPPAIATAMRAVIRRGRARKNSE